MIPIKELRITRPGAGGAVEKISGTEIEDNQSARYDSSTLPLKNCHTNEIGKIVKRSGYTEYSSGAITISGSPDIELESICGFFQYLKFSGVKTEVVAASNESYQKIVNLTSVSSPVDITGSVTFTHDTYFHFCQVADKLIMTTEDRDAPIQWSGTGDCTLLRQTISGSPDTYVNAPYGKYCAEFYNYCFIANTSANPERLYWSGLFDPESWTVGSDFKRLENACTGMIKRGDNLFAFTENSIWLIQYTGDSTTPFTFDRLDSAVGCVSARTLVNIEGVIHWLGNDGHVYRMAQYKPERVTEAIPTTISGCNIAAFNIACAIDHKELRQYWCAVPRTGSTVNNFVIVLDYLNNEIYLYDGMSINSMANFTDSNGITKTYFGDRTGRICLTNNGDADYPGGTKTAITYWKFTKIFNFGSPNTKKRIRRVKVTANNSGNFNSLITLYGDFGGSGGQALAIKHLGNGDLLGTTWILGTSALGRESDVSCLNDLAINCSYLQMKLSDATLDYGVEIRDIVVEYQEYSWARY